MDTKYSKWISDYVARTPYMRGRCGSATQEMVESFPELRRVPGWASAVEHWWCETPEGEIVDPTVSQFDGDEVSYKEWKPGDEVRVGRCMNCGIDIWRAVQTLTGDRPCICSDECSEDFIKSEF
jgi:hypothetical protein